MSNSIAPGSSADVNVKVTALTTNSNVPVTYKTIILKKNLVNGVNTLTQAMMNQTNVKYVIKYDYTLDGNINIPNGCILEFDGGSLINGTLNNVYKIKNYTDSVIFKNVIINSVINEDYVKLKWFYTDNIKYALETAAKFGNVDCDGIWDISNSQTIVISNDVELYNGTFLCANNPDEDEHNNIRIESNDVLLVPSVCIGLGRGSTQINYEPAKDYKYVTLRSDTDIWYNGEGRNGKCGETMPILSIGSGVTKFNDRSGVICNYIGNVYGEFFNPINIKVRDIVFQAPVTQNADQGSEYGKNLLTLKYCIATVENCKFYGGRTAVQLDYSVNSIIKGCNVENTYPWGICFSDSNLDCIAIGNFANNNRHGFSILGQATVAKNCLICNNVFKNSIIGAINTHANAYGTVIEGNLIEDSVGGIVVFSPYTTIQNNVIINGSPVASGTGAQQIELLECAVNCTVKGNVIQGWQGYIAAIYCHTQLNGASYNVEPKFFNIVDNVIFDAPNGPGIQAFVDDTSLSMTCDVTGNKIRNIGYEAINVVAFVEAIVLNNSIRNIGRNSIGVIGSVDTSKHGKCYFNNNTIDIDGVSAQFTGYEKINTAGNIIKDNNNDISLVDCTYHIMQDTKNVTGGSRPLLSADAKGNVIFDNDANKPLWWNGLGYVDAFGLGNTEKVYGTTAERNWLSCPIGTLFFDTDLLQWCVCVGYNNDGQGHYFSIWNSLLDDAIAFRNKGTTSQREPTSAEDEHGFFPYAVGHNFYDTTLKQWMTWDGTRYTNLDGTPLQKSGTYADRPTSGVPVGFGYFATDKGAAGVGAMIYYTGNNTTPWVYADGTAVS